jgi:hypothetical protein
MNLTIISIKVKDFQVFLKKMLKIIRCKQLFLTKERGFRNSRCIIATLLNRQPEAVDFFCHLDKRLESRRLDQIRAAFWVEAFKDVLVSTRRGQDYNRDSAQSRVGLNFPNYFPAGFFGHIEVEDYKLRSKGMGETGPAEEKIDGFDAVIYDVEAML